MQASMLVQRTPLQQRVAKSVQAVGQRGSRQVTRAELFTDSQLVISGANAVMLGLGRFVFLPYQRDRVASAGLPKQNGMTHLEAGDRLAAEASFLQTTNDPAGFNLVDVMAWGALGHALGFAILAVNVNAIPH